MGLQVRNTLLLLFIAAFLATVAACNTMKGVGRDTEAVGNKIEREADRHLDGDEDSRP